MNLELLGAKTPTNDRSTAWSRVVCHLVTRTRTADTYKSFDGFRPPQLQDHPPRTSPCTLVTGVKLFIRCRQDKCSQWTHEYCRQMFLLEKERVWKASNLWQIGVCVVLFSANKSWKSPKDLLFNWNILTPIWLLPTGDSHAPQVSDRILENVEC